MNSAISLNNLNKDFKRTKIIKNINLEVETGKIYGIIGRNGSGKSILFKLICGLLVQSSGSIKVFEEKITKGIFPKNIGILLDSTGFIPNYSAFTNLKSIAIINNIISDDDIRKSLKIVGLNPADKKPIKKYSIGMKQKLGIAQAIMEKPKLLLLDEPMNGLDEESVNKMRNLLIKLNKEQNVTILLTSHNREDINILCDKIYKLDKGTLLEEL